MKNSIFALLLFSIEICYAMPGQVMIIRHAERRTTTYELTGTGIERAQALGSYFTQINDSNSSGWQGQAGLTNVTLFDYGPPCALYAARPVHLGGDFNTRCIQTLTPTALMLNLPLHTSFGPGQEQELAQSILNNPEYDGKNILICWHEGLIPILIAAFGYICPYTPETYPNVFDFVWVMTFPAPLPAEQLTPVYQELLYGDSPTPP
jgi:hypothetical protein